MNVYSSLKIFHHQDRIAALRSGGHPPPVHVHLVPTNRCNMRCNFCAYRTHGYSSSEDFHPSDQIPTERLLSLPGELQQAGVKAVELTGGGEPTVHPALPQFCRGLLENGIDYGLVTNGWRLSDECFDAIHYAKWVRVSIDAGTAETYSATRSVPPEVYAVVRDNLRRMVRERRERMSPVIGVGFVVTADNWEEILTATRNAEEDGVDNVRISAVFQSDGVEYFSPFYAGAKNLCSRASRLNNSTFRVFDLFGERIEDLKQSSPDYRTCRFQRMVTYVGADLNVYRCCVLAFNPLGLLGSIKDRPFGEFWDDPKTGHLLESFDARECERCMFNAKNRTIEYAVDPDPPHVNFL